MGIMSRGEEFTALVGPGGAGKEGLVEVGEIVATTWEGCKKKERNRG